jgi:hypothetical protein
MSEATIDPRVSSVTVIRSDAGAPLGTYVRVDLVTIDGVKVTLPKPHPGVPDYASAAHAELEADRFRSQLLRGLDTRGDVPYQPDGGLVLDFYAACGTAVIAATSGVESFTNHHLHRHCPPGQTIEWEGEPTTSRGCETCPSIRGSGRCCRILSPLTARRSRHGGRPSAGCRASLRLVGTQSTSL